MRLVTSLLVACGLAAAALGVATARPASADSPVDYFVELCRDPELAKQFPQHYRVVLGTSGDDELRGSPRMDVMYGFGGNDLLRGGMNDDVLCGGYGRDRLIGGMGTDGLLGQQGADTLRGGWSTDLLIGGWGYDDCDGGPAAESVFSCP